MRAIALDCDYTLIQPWFTPYARFLYRLLRKISGNRTEKLINLSYSSLGNWTEYLIEEVLFKLFPISSSPLVSLEILSETHKKYRIGVFSRRPCAWRDIVKARYDKCVDVFVGREEVGSGVIRREHVAKCVQQLDKPEMVLVVSDSPRDINKGKSLGAKTCAIPSYYSKSGLEKYKPDMVIPSLQELLLLLNTGSISF